MEVKLPRLDKETTDKLLQTIEALEKFKEIFTMISEYEKIDMEVLLLKIDAKKDFMLKFISEYGAQ